MNSINLNLKLSSLLFILQYWNFMQIFILFNFHHGIIRLYLGILGDEMQLRSWFLKVYPMKRNLAKLMIIKV